MSKPKITDVKKLVEEYQSGLSTVELGKRYDTSATVIRRWLTGSGIKLRTLKDARKLVDISGPKNPNYQGKGKYAEDGTYLSPDANGYLSRIAHGHPLAFDKGRIHEHVYQACLKYGVENVRGKDVHHIDGNVQNNAPDNLVPMTYSEHRSYENWLEWRNETRKRKVR